MSKGSRAKVLFEYIPENEDELELTVGAIIMDIVANPEEDGWLEGTLNGRRGVFPDNFVEILPDAAPAEPVVEKREKRRFARTTFSYTADNEDELTLDVGDVVEVLGEEEDGWWSGKFNGKTGVFPNNFVEEISEEDATGASKKKEEPSKPAEVPKVEESKGPKTARGMSGAVKLPFMVPPGAGPAPSAASEPPPEPEPSRDSGPAGSKVEKAKVIFEYTAEADDELSLAMGDVVEITSKTVSDGWWEGKIGGKVGVFPNNFVELLPVEEAPLPKKPAMSNKVQVMPVKLTPADLKKVADEKKTEPPQLKVDLPKKPEEPKAKPVPLKPVPGRTVPPPGGPKPPAKPQAPAPPTGRKPPPSGKRPQPPTKATDTKKEEESTPPQKSARTQPEREQPPTEPPKPLRPTPKPAESNDKDSQPAVAPWMKELRSRKNTNEENAVRPKLEPKKPPPPVSAQVPPPVAAQAPPAAAASAAPHPAASPPSAGGGGAKQANGAAKPAPVESEPAPAKESDTDVSSTAVAELQEELAKLKQKLSTMEASFNQEIERLEIEIDEEKKSRMTMQVEIDRLKRRKD